MILCKKTIFVFVIAIAITGCITDKLRGFGVQDRVEPENIIEISADSVLDRDFTNTQFNVKSDVVLDLAGHKIDGQQDKGRIICMFAEPGAQIVNGTISRCDMGIRLRSDSGFRVTDELLNADIEGQKRIIQKFIDSGKGNQVVSGIKFEKNTRAVYVDRFAHSISIVDNEFLNTDLMGIYLDADSHDNIIENNRFNTCGFGRISIDRECIAVDASSNNLMTNNTFKDAALAGIALYKNCGEKQVPRPNGANNNKIINNHFEKMGVGINVSSRVIDRVSSTCRLDDEGDIVEGTILSGNTFRRVKTNIIRNDLK